MPSSLQSKWIQKVKDLISPEGDQVIASGLEFLISPYHLELPASVLKNVERIVDCGYRLSRNPYARSDQEWTMSPLAAEVAEKKIPHASVLMAYDFHYQPESGELKLIEINTNAAGFFLQMHLQELHGISTSRMTDSLQKSFIEDLKINDRPNVLIIDESPMEQKMYAEFLLYKKWFEKMGWSVRIEDARNLELKNSRLQVKNENWSVDAIYNRSTDFYFEHTGHEALRAAYLQDLCRISPNPREYFLLADKARYVQWSLHSEKVASSAADLEILKKYWLKTFFMQSRTPDEVWTDRKHLFFKPAQSYGGKSVYRGESMSRKVFDRALSENFLAQQFFPAGEVEMKSDGSRWKYDLRFYVYKNQIQSWCARLYQGQVTNFRTLGGGFSPVIFS